MTVRAMPEAARALERHAGELANDASLRLLAQRPSIGERLGEDAPVVWSEHLRQRLLELSAALSAGQADLFVSRVTWSRTALAARQIDADDLQSSLLQLREVIGALLRDEALQTAREFIDCAIKALKNEQVDSMATALDPGILTDRIAQRYIKAVIAGNVQPGMGIVLDAVDDGISIRDAILKVLLPAQREVGRLWHLDEISVAEEHMVTVTTQRLMAVLASRAEYLPNRGRTVVAAAVAGNIHDMGIRAIAYLIEMAGWRTIFLGPDVPKRDIPAAVDCFDADLVMLSLALSSQLPMLQRTIDAIRESNGKDVRIMIGGNGLAGVPDLWRELGADGYASTAHEAIRLADELVPLS